MTLIGQCNKVSCRPLWVVATNNKQIITYPSHHVHIGVISILDFRYMDCDLNKEKLKSSSVCHLQQVADILINKQMLFHLTDQMLNQIHTGDTAQQEGHSMETFSSAINSAYDRLFYEGFWLPKNLTWKDFELNPNDGIYVAQPRHLIYVFACALVIFCIRQLFER